MEEVFVYSNCSTNNVILFCALSDMLIDYFCKNNEILLLSDEPFQTSVVSRKCHIVLRVNIHSNGLSLGTLGMGMNHFPSLK